MRIRFVALSILAMTSAARADSDFVFDYIGFAYAHQSNEFETAQIKATYTDSYVGMDGYMIGPMVYAKFSHGFWHGIGGAGDFKVTDKATGMTETRGKAQAMSDMFLVLLPRLELGVALGQSVFHPTIGLYLGDSNQQQTDGTPGSGTLYYTVDTGIVAGLALAAGSEKAGFVIHPTIRLNASFYDQETKVFDGSGGAIEVTAAAKFGKFAVFIRAGAEGHDLNGTKWFDSDPGEQKIHASTAYFHLGLGYSAI